MKMPAKKLIAEPMSAAGGLAVIYYTNPFPCHSLSFEREKIFGVNSAVPVRDIMGRRNDSVLRNIYRVDRVI